ncbi:hypothetical protein SHAM105786_05690 [Shewanella amazonensis]|uniref:Uncharacterized protein n=1 Tax=Shewanella amazonensis (strain ATCC BAA-1098 / SB2B) TaxID=326297 RepID=A1S993_SHEAM|nr:hypothetical protein [Shewanella amazonensis]ABM00950.1 conserved hypothetical protein [Shewanella amazonensis SB2B]
MANIQLKQEDALSIKFSHQLGANDSCRLDLYFALPKEMGIGPESLDEEEYFHSAILGRRAYYSDGLHLPLVQSRFVSLNKRTMEEFRLYLNLFAYQFAVAMENDTKELLQLKTAEEFYPRLGELGEQVGAILKKFRRSEPTEPKWKPWFEHADNYLSWHCEQKLLQLMMHAPDIPAEDAEGPNTVREAVLSLCRAEALYRDSRHYNSEKTKSDHNRISNKMLLLRRLIQQGVVLKEELKPLGVGLKKFVTGLATGLVMLVVSALIIKAQGVFSGVTMSLLLTLAVIYGFREIFKEDIRNAMWRVIQRGRPRWSRLLRDTSSQKVVARQQVWLDFVRSKDLPLAVTEILSRRHQQNRLEAEYLHYGISTKVNDEGFLAGYDTLSEQVSFSLVPFVRYLERGKVKVFRETEEGICAETAERRYQINVVLVYREGRKAPRYARYKVTLNRSGIISVSEKSLPEQLLGVSG